MTQSRLRPLGLWQGLGAVALALPVLFSTQAAAADYVLVFAGQSNMVGIGTWNNPPPSGDQGPIPNVKGFYTNSFCDGAQVPGPEATGENSYVDYAAGKFNTGPLWATRSYTTANGLRAVGGTWQDYQWWRSSWTGKNPFTGSDFVYTKTQGYNTGRLGNFWHIGLNPGDNKANAWDFGNGPAVTGGTPTTPKSRVNIQAFGPELGVAKAVAAARPTDRFWIVKYAYGGSALAKNSDVAVPYDWDPTSTNELYQGMKDWVTLARASLPSPATNAKVAGFFWMQGETDARTATFAQNYEQNLTALIAKIRADFEVPQLPVVMGLVRTDCGANASKVREGQNAVDTADARVVVIETNGLTMNNPDWTGPNLAAPSTSTEILHYNSTSVMALGASMGAAWLDLVPSVPPGPTNARPIVTANPDRTVIWPAVVNLTPVVTDPEGDSLTYLWTVENSPTGAGVFIEDRTALQLSDISFTAQGVYTLRLTVKDGKGPDVTDDVKITVVTERQRLFIFAGDQNMNSEGVSATLATEDSAQLTDVRGYYWRAPTASFSGASPWVPTTAAWEPYFPWKAPANSTEYVGLNPGDAWSTIDTNAKRRFGPEFTAAKVIQQTLGQPIRVIKYSASYSHSLITDWMKSTDWDATDWETRANPGRQYEAMRDWVRQAIASENVTIAGFFWVHGAADDGAVSKQKYARALLSLGRRFRTDFGADIPIVMSYYKTGTPVRQAQFEVATGLTVDSSGAAPQRLGIVDLGALTSPYSRADTKDAVGTPLGNAWLSLTRPLAPSVSAGANHMVTLPNTVTLAGTAVDAGDVLTYMWTQESGPDVVDISDAYRLDPVISCPIAGTYILRLTVGDAQGNIVTSDVTITASDPAGSTTAGSTTAGSTTAGSTTAGSTTAGSTTAGSTTAGSTTAGSTTAGSTTAGSTTAGSTTAGVTTAGVTTAGITTSGSASGSGGTASTGTGTGTGAPTASGGGTGVVIESSGNDGGGCGMGAMVAVFLGMLGVLACGRRYP